MNKKWNYKIARIVFGIWSLILVALGIAIVVIFGILSNIEN